MVPGCLAKWLPHGVYGVVEEVDHRRVTIALDTGTTQIFTLDAGVVARVEIGMGSQVVVRGNDVPGVVMAPVPGQQKPTWKVAFPGRTVNVPEASLRPAELKDPLERLRNKHLGRALDFNLKSVAADLWTQHLHNELVSLAHARVDLRPHQVGVVHRVVTNYPHRFLLADEVGLGKTIEAAMVVKELRARKQVNRVLVLVPSGLQTQWQFELKTKFNESFAIYNKQTLAYLKNQGVEHPWTHHDLVIASHTWASWTESRREEIMSVDWDLVIVDEAHHAREQRYGRRVQRTKLYRLVRELIGRPEHNRRATLLLTATPMQLQRHELYSLVEMLDPILFASEQDFVHHVTSLGGLSGIVDRLKTEGKPLEASERLELATDLADTLDWSEDETRAMVEEMDAAALADTIHDAHRLGEVLIRNRRATVGGFQPRAAYRWPVTMTKAEQDAYDMLQKVLSQGFDMAERTGSNAVGFLMTTFQKLATSSSRALLASLEKRRLKLLTGPVRSRGDSEILVEEALDSDSTAAEATDELAPDADLDISLLGDLIALLSRIDHDSKVITLAQRLHDLFQDDPAAKVLIFTQFRETQAMLSNLLEGSGWGVNLFHGQMNPREKDDAVDRFRTGAGPQILVSTEAGGEGRNFQFCHILVNYDLPWNPMKVEQRIGRVDRIGQEHPVVVFNLFVEGTIEERVLDVLENRVHLFTEAIGGLEPIIGDVETDIRKAIRLAGEEQERRLRKLAEDTERKVREARAAEKQMADLILDTKSFGAGIARIAREAEQPVTQHDYERFLRHLLQSANTYIKAPDENGVHKLMFHAPFSLEHPELIDGRDKRRVCFDPQSHVDSENVEYMGFGHPIIDTLTEDRISDWTDGAAAVRKVFGFPESGWQFNWLVKIGAVRVRRFVHPIFVGDDGTVDRHLGEQLLKESRAFRREEAPMDEDAPNPNRFHELALADVSALITDLEIKTKAEAADRLDEERNRIEAAHRHRTRAAQDKLESVRATLAKLEASDRTEDRNVIPLWRANVERAVAELLRIDKDRDEMLADLMRCSHPQIEYELLNLARIVGQEAG